MLNLKNCLKRKLVPFYKVKLSRFRFYNKYINRIKKISNFFNVFFLGFVKISLLKIFFSYQIETLIKNNFFIFKYLKSFISVKTSKKKYFFNNLLNSARRANHSCLAYKRYYFLIRLSRKGKFSKLNIIKSKPQLKFRKSKKINKKDLYLIFGNYLKNGRIYVVKKKNPIIIKPFYKNFFTNFNAEKKNNVAALKSNIKKNKKKLAVRFKKNTIKLKLKKKIRKKRILINKKSKTIKHLKKLLFLKKKIFINRAMAGRFSFFFLNASSRFVARKKKKRRKRLVAKKSRFITVKKRLKYFFRKKRGNYASIFFPSFLLRGYKKKTWKKRNIYLISFLKRKIRVLRKNLRKKKLRKEFRKLLKKKFSSKKKRFIFKKKTKKLKKYSFFKKKPKKKIYYYRRRRFRRNFYNNHLKKKLINSRIKKYYFFISRWRRNKINRRLYKTIFFKNLQLEQKSFLKNKLNFVGGYSYFLNNFGNSFFFRIKFLKFFNFNITLLSALNKRFLKKNLSFFTENSRKRKKKHLIEKFFGFNSKIYKINNFDKFKFLKLIFQKNKKPFYIFDSSNFFQSKNSIVNNSHQIFSMKSTFNKFFYSFLNNTGLIKNQLSPCFFYDFFLHNLLDIKFFFKLIFNLKKSKFNFIYLLRKFIKPLLVINHFIFKKKNWIDKYFFKKSLTASENSHYHNYYRRSAVSRVVYKRKLWSKRIGKLRFLRKKRFLPLYKKKTNLQKKFKNIKKKNYLSQAQKKKKFKFNKKFIISRSFFHKIFKIKKKTSYLNNKLKILKKSSNSKYKKQRKISIKVFFRNKKFFRKNFLYNLRVTKSFFRFFEHPYKLIYLFIKKLFLSTIKHGKKEKAFYLLYFCSKNLRSKFKNISFISFMSLIFKKLDCPITIRNTPLLKRGKVPREDYRDKIKLDNRRLKFPVKWIVDSARNRREKNFALKLFNELLDIYLSKNCDTIKKLKEFNRIIFYNRRLNRNWRRGRRRRRKNYKNFSKQKRI